MTFCASYTESTSILVTRGRERKQLPWEGHDGGAVRARGQTTWDDNKATSLVSALFWALATHYSLGLDSR